MIKRLCIYVLITFIVVWLYLYVLFTPPYATSIHFQQNQINITRDAYGIPHIHAPTRRSFLYAWGYVLAEDRLFQIAFRRLFAQGRLSEFLGSRALQSDIMMRDLSLSQVAQHIAAKIKAQNETIYWDMSAFAEGINDQAKIRCLLPFQFYLLKIKWEPWTIESSLKLFKLLQFSISHNMIQEYSRSGLLANYSIFQINKLIPNTKENWAFPSQTVIKDQDIPQHLQSNQINQNGLFEPLEIQKIIELGMPEYFISAEGSNAWVVSGEHTESGKPILSGDPHLDSSLPGHWYQFKATYTQNNKTVRYAGVAPPGIMMTHGKSDYYAVGLAVLQTDTQDLYKQKINGSRYLVDGQWRKLRVRNQSILIREGNQKVVYNHTIKITHRGPILNYIVSPFGTFQLPQPLSLAWTGYNQDYKSMINAGFYLIQADNLKDMLPVLINGTSHFYSLSILFATQDNHIIYQQCGANPLRNNSTSGSYVKDGTSTKHDWLGLISPHQRMHVLNPKSGFIVTSNNRVASNLYRGGYFDHMIYTARADRLTQVIQKEIDQGRKITNQFALKLLYDTVDVYCRQILPQIVSISPKAQQILRDFDCNFSTDSYQATIYEVFMFELWHLIKPIQYQNFSLLSFHVFQQSIYNVIHQAFNGKLSKQISFHKAWDLAQIRLIQFFKTKNHSQWKWGLFHRDISTQLPLGHHQFFSYFYRRQSPGYGNYHTPNVAKSNKLELGIFVTSHRANLRTIYDYGGQSWWGVDGGVSQNILTKHYDDQWKMFIQQKLIPISFDNQEITTEL